MPNSAILGVVLAGGAGSRLGGANKAALSVGGRSLLERAVAALAPAARIAVAGGARVDADLAGGLERLPDPVAGAGPLAGLAAGLAWAEAAGADLLLTTPVDAPFLTADAFAALAAAAEPGLDAVILEAGGRTQWLAAAWRPGLAAAAGRALDGEDRSIARFARSLAWRPLALDGDGSMFLNVNAPADLAAARALADSTEGS